MQNNSSDETPNNVPQEDEVSITSPVEVNSNEFNQEVEPVVVNATETEATVSYFPTDNTAEASVSTAPASEAPTIVTTETITETVAAAAPVAAATVFGGGDTGLEPPKKKAKKGLIIGIIVAAVLVVLGAGTVLAYNLWYQNPNKVVTDALVNSMTAKTMQLTGKVDVKSDDYTVKVAIDAKGTQDTSEVAVDIEYVATADDTTLKLKGTGHFTTTGDLYVKVENLRELVDTFAKSADIETTQFDSLVTKVDGNWIKITSDDLGEVSEEYKKTQLCFEELAKEVKEDKSLSKEVGDLYAKNQFLKTTESLGSRDINGVGSLGYAIDLDYDKLKTFVSGVATTKLGEKLKDCDDQYDFAKLADDIDASEVTESTGKVEVWASRFGHELTEINTTNSEDGVESTIVLNPVFNKEFTLETPKDALTIDELKAEIEKVYESYSSSTPAATTPRTLTN